jgi:branched-chain amino acid transport system substrate-binding protein
VQTENYPSSAIVFDSGDIEELDGARGRRLLTRDPCLVAYAKALSSAEDTEVRFFWRHVEDGWVRVRIDRSAVGSPNGPRSIVTLIREDPPFGLTERELDVLTLLSGGLSNREIAGRLGASSRTVSTHVEHILMKLGQRSRAGAAAMAVDRGLLRMPLPSGSHGMDALTICALERVVEGRGDGSQAFSRRARRPRPFVIGSAIPLSGPAWGDGVEMRNGASLAIEEVNARGGVAGRRIEQMVVDADILTQDGIRLAIEALASAEVDAIRFGYVLSPGEEVLELAADYGSPLLHAITAEEPLRRVRNDPRRFRRVFQVCPSEIHYGRGFATFLDGLVSSGRWDPGCRSVAIVETTSEGGRMSTSITLEALERDGWSLDAVECVPEVGTDWSALVLTLRDIAPAAVLIANYVPSELAAFQRAFVAEQLEALVYAVYTPSIPEFLALAGSAAEGIVWSTVSGTYRDPLGVRFVDRYTQAFGRPPGRSHAGIAYDEVYLLAHAWASVGNPRDFEGVAQHLRRGAYRGVNGAYFFDDDQGALAYPDMTLDPSLGQAHLVIQVQQGAHRILGPPPYAEATFERPSWWPAMVA